MRDVYLSLLTALNGLLALWLIWGFWPLSTGSRGMLSLLVLLICGVMLWRQWGVARLRHDGVSDINDGSLPPEDFQGAVVLVCGDSTPLFAAGERHRETRQGWFLQVNAAEQLPLLVQHLTRVRPALVAQISVMLALLPECHHSQDEFTQRLRGWQRAIVQCRAWLGGLPPLWTVTWVSPPGGDEESAVWFTTASNHAGMQVYQPGQGNLSLADWIRESDAETRFMRLGSVLWLDSVLDWQRAAVDSVWTVREGALPALNVCAQGIGMVPVDGQSDNLWQQHIASVTTLSPNVAAQAEPLPLPELLLANLPRRRGISRRMQFWRYVGLSGGAFLILAMLASFINNQRLIRSVGDHLALYHHLSGKPPAPKLQAQQTLRADARKLDDWQRRGEPLRYRVGLYQGGRLVAPLEAAMSDWAPPPPPPPVIQKIVPGPKTVRLDSLSLFDSGKAALKTGSTKVLVNALVGIKAKPGWLIVVSGHT
ncbi:OmpA family protein, partial [Serratia sp. NPDC078593]|uniref:OmpA family protein n=1 Tax=unclassified Serratia (in: enterobacteria) TaxID=2647522 RepID=UPI0037D1780B